MKLIPLPMGARQMIDPRIETLIASFYDDPLAQFFWPNEELRAKQLSAGLEFILKLSSMILSSETANRKCAGVIAATRPGRYPPPFFHSMGILRKDFLQQFSHRAPVICCLAIRLGYTASFAKLEWRPIYRSLRACLTHSTSWYSLRLSPGKPFRK
jgi:hypothetical protein